MVNPSGTKFSGDKIVPQSDLRAGTALVLAYKKVKFSRYRPGVAQRVGRRIALLFHDRGTRRG